MIWRYDREHDELPNVFGEVDDAPIFVVTAYCKLVMPTPQPDTRSDHRKTLDEQLAAEPLLPIEAPDPGEVLRPLEAHLRPLHPVAVVGVVENGVVRLLDTGVTFPERSRVIVVAADPRRS